VRRVARSAGLLLLAIVTSSCAVVSLKMYEGPPKPDAEVSIVRLWGPAVIVQKIDGKDAGVRGTESHAYVLPGDHEFEVKLIRIRGYHLLCGALCDAIFNKPKIVKGATQPGHTYTLKLLNDEQGNVVLDDRGTSYDPVCLEPRNYRDGKNC
jgi:hypothetical protein